MSKVVAILGASENPERFAYRALHSLKDHGYQTIPVNPTLQEISGETVVPTLNDIQSPVNTLTMYVNPKVSTKLKNDILKLKPARVIFNPGAENPELEKDLKAAGIHVIDACTLVLLSTNRFENA